MYMLVQRVTTKESAKLPCRMNPTDVQGCQSGWVRGQPLSQGLSSPYPKGSEGGEMKDPGNEVGSEVGIS